jgi:hypothetical protein
MTGIAPGCSGGLILAESKSGWREWVAEDPALLAALKPYRQGPTTAEVVVQRDEQVQ